MPCSPGHLLDTHQKLLERWRKAMNLVGPGPTAIHYDDAKLALADLDGIEGRWADLGTGAGFPGIVFTAQFPDVQVELVDSRSKRCRFLDEVLFTSGWEQATVHCTRHETLEDGTYDGILSRALHAPERMVEVARRLVRPGGSLLLFLQFDAPVPEADDVTLVRTTVYTVDGKRRKCAHLHIGA